MKVQEAAYRLLTEQQTPMSSRELARIILEKNLVSSRSRDPVLSISSTLEKNIRDGVYNEPELRFVHDRGRRLIGLPSWQRQEAEEVAAALPAKTALSINLPSELADQLHLAAQAKLATSFDETVALALRKGLSALASQIEEGLQTQLSKLRN